MLQRVKDRLIYDIDKKRDIKKNERAIVPTNDPVLYTKLNGFIEGLIDAIGSNKPVARLDFGPNEFSDGAGDRAQNQRYSQNLAKNLRDVEEAIDKPEGMRTFDNYSRFRVKGVIPVSAIDLEGKTIEQLMKDPKAVVPELGKVTVGKNFLNMDKLGLGDGAWAVIVQDSNELIDSQDMNDKIKIKGGLWKKFTSNAGMIRYKSHGQLKPKKKLDLIQAAVAKAVGQSENAIGVMPVRTPTSYTSTDPDKSSEKEHRYWIFTFVANTGGVRSASQRDAIKKAIEAETFRTPEFN